MWQAAVSANREDIKQPPEPGMHHRTRHYEELVCTLKPEARVATWSGSNQASPGMVFTHGEKRGGVVIVLAGVPSWALAGGLACAIAPRGANAAAPASPPYRRRARAARRLLSAWVAAETVGSNRRRVTRRQARRHPSAAGLFFRGRQIRAARQLPGGAVA